MPNPRWRENRPAQSWISTQQPACNRRMTPVLIVRAWPARLALIGRQADDSAAWPKCTSRRLANCSTQSSLYVMAVALNLHSISAVGRGGQSVMGRADRAVLPLRRVNARVARFRALDRMHRKSSSRCSGMALPHKERREWPSPEV